MIDKKEIMKQIMHMETSTPEQREMQKEAFRLIQEREELQKETFRLIQERREKHEKTITDLRIQIQEIRASTPKMQIYFGKVKTE
jgi:hypothetical protein